MLSLLCSSSPLSLCFLQVFHLPSHFWSLDWHHQCGWHQEDRLSSLRQMTVSFSPLPWYFSCILILCQVLSVHWWGSGSQRLCGCYGEFQTRSIPLYWFSVLAMVSTIVSMLEMVVTQKELKWEIEPNITLFLLTLTCLFLTLFLTLNSLNEIDNRLNKIFT